MTAERKILVVDDHVALAENIAEILNDSGIQTVTAVMMSAFTDDETIMVARVGRDGRPRQARRSQPAHVDRRNDGPFMRRPRDRSS